MITLVSNQNSPTSNIFGQSENNWESNVYPIHQNYCVVSPDERQTNKKDNGFSSLFWREISTLLENKYVCLSNSIW